MTGDRASYFENRGPRDWRPVTVVCRYGGGPLPAPVFPEVRTRPTPPRNVMLRRTDGELRIVPVRTLRRERPC